MNENEKVRRAGRVENRRPSDVFLALWRYYALDQRDRASVDDFAVLADVWQQIRELEICAVRDYRWESARVEEIFRAYCAPDDGEPSSAPDGAPSPEEEGETVPESDTEDEPGDPSPAAPDDGDELEAQDLDGLEIPAGEKPYKGYLATVKNRTRNRLLEMRARGLTTGQLMAAADGCLGYDDLMSILEAKPVRFDVYERLAEVLDEIDGKKAK